MKAAEVVLTSEERATLRSWRAAGKTERRMAFRAAVILAVAEGLSNEAVAVRLGTRPATVSKWRGRFARDGLPGLADAPRSGKRPITRPSTSGGFWRLWMSHRRPVMDAGTEPCWPGIWVTSRSIRSGASCAGTRSRWHGAAAGVSAPIPASRRRLPTSSGSICSHRRMRCSGARSGLVEAAQWQSADGV